MQPRYRWYCWPLPTCFHWRKYDLGGIIATMRYVQKLTWPRTDFFLFVKLTKCCPTLKNMSGPILLLKLDTNDCLSNSNKHPIREATWVLGKPANGAPICRHPMPENENFIYTWLHQLYLLFNETLDTGIPYKTGRREWPVKMNTTVILLHQTYVHFTLIW